MTSYRLRTNGEKRMDYIEAFDACEFMDARCAACVLLEPGVFEVAYPPGVPA